MSIPELDSFFHNPESEQLKEVFMFVVDNGPSEAAANITVQLLLARLVKFLNLDKAVQRSFAEYLQYRSKVSYHPLARRDSRLERRDSRLARG